MSTGPVLLGRVTGLNVGDTSDTPKREGQSSPPCHLDIEVSPSPTVTRVTYGDSQHRPSWTWRFLQMFIALLVVIFTTWLAIAISSQEAWGTPSYGYSYGVYGYSRIEVAALKHDPSFIALMVSTGIAGLAAMWLYLIAPTAHTLLAARFLCLNWVEGLVMLSSFAAEKEKGSQIWKLDWSFLMDVRMFLLLLELLGLQFLIANRLQSLWPALNRPGCKVWLARCLRMEVAGLFLGALDIFPMSSVWSWVPDVTAFCKYQIVPFCFLIWTLLVATTLFRVVLMFQKALELTRKQGLAVAATFQACRGRSILQCAGVIISLTTSVMLYSSWAFRGFDLIFSPIFVIQCINLLVNTAGITLLSGASSLITSQGTLKFPPLKCCQCPCQFPRCHGFQFFKSLCRSKLKICEENAWEKKTRELANRGISLEELLVF